MSRYAAKNTIFVDCGWLHKDLYDIVYELAMILEQRNIVLYAALVPRLNQILVYLRDRFSVCDYAPEINVLLTNSTDFYLAKDEDLQGKTQRKAAELLEALSTNLDGSKSEKEVKLTAPIFASMSSRDMIKQVHSSNSLVLIVLLFMLSSVVVYTLMIADVEE